MQGDQYLEKVILNFETFSLYDEKNDSLNSSKVINTEKLDLSDNCLNGSFVAVALNAESTNSVLSSTKESVYDLILCGHLDTGSKKLESYISIGPRIVVVFGSTDFNFNYKNNKHNKYGFRARIDFKTGKKYIFKINY